MGAHVLLGKIKKIVAVFAASSILLASLSACSSTSSVAATVNGEEITEDRVTSYITAMRIAYSLDDDEDWASYLDSAGFTPAEIREQAIQVIAEEILVANAAIDAGYTVDEEDIDSAIESISSQYDSDAEFQAALAAQGTTEEQLREDYRNYMYQLIIQDEVISDPDPTDEEIQDTIDSNIDYYDGAKRSSHILFSTDDQDTAQTVLDELIAGEADFAEMAEQYSQDSSGSSGGDVGWDCEATFVDAYQEALDSLSVGEMTQELVESEYGYHIILCTDEFNVEEGVTYTADNLPESIYTLIYDDLVDSLKSAEYSEYVQALVDSAEIVINDMPEGLSYDVTVEEETTDESSDESSEETTDSDTDTDESTEDSTETE